MVTGASGVRLALRAAEVLSKHVEELYAVYTRAALRVAEAEEGIRDLPTRLSLYASSVYSEDEIDAPLASSSNTPDAVVVIPCSQATLARIAHGLADNLAARVALNALRLRRPLVLVVRETPISAVDALNMLIASLAGATILPATIAFYHNPKTVDDMIDFIVGKVLDVLDVDHALYRRWRGYRRSSSTSKP